MTLRNFDWLSEGARKNPEGLLLLAAGAVLLMRGRSRSGASAYQARPSAYGDYDGQGYNSRYGQPDSDRQPPGAISRAATTAKDYASGIKDTVSDVAGDYVSAASDYVSDAGRTIADRSGDLAHGAQSTFQQGVDRVLQEQPLAIALAGFAAGAAVAAAFPVSTFERDALGGVGERLSDAADEGKRMLGTAATAAKDEIQKVASEKGISSDGLKDAARNVSEAVESSLSTKSTPAASQSSQSSDQSSGNAMQTPRRSNGG